MQRLSRVASETIAINRRQLAEALVAREFASHPALAERYGALGRQKSLQDAGYHLDYLAVALAFDSRALFTDYVAWAKIVLHQRQVLASDLAFHLECAAHVLHEQLPAALAAQASAFIGDALIAMPAMPEELPTFMVEGNPLSPLAYQVLQALLRGERRVASRLVLDAVHFRTPVKDVYLQVCQPAQREIGRLWQHNRISVAREHYCTAAMQLILSQLYSGLFAGVRTGRTLVATCVAGDLHEVGVRMVADFFEMDGWDTFYSGANTPHAAVIDAVVERRADVLAVSATISHHVREVQSLIAAVRCHPECGRVKILVGGYPFTLAPDLWRQVGADGFALDAQGAIDAALGLLSMDANAGSENREGLRS